MQNTVANWHQFASSYCQDKAFQRRATGFQGAPPPPLSTLKEVLLYFVTLLVWAWDVDAVWGLVYSSCPSPSPSPSPSCSTRRRTLLCRALAGWIWSTPQRMVGSQRHSRCTNLRTMEAWHWACTILIRYVLASEMAKLHPSSHCLSQTPIHMLCRQAYCRHSNSMSSSKSVWNNASHSRDLFSTDYMYLPGIVAQHLYT